MTDRKNTRPTPREYAAHRLERLAEWVEEMPSQTTVDDSGDTDELDLMNMAAWVTRYGPRCGTVACLAGHAVELYGDATQRVMLAPWRPNGNIGQTATALLGINAVDVAEGTADSRPTRMGEMEEAILRRLFAPRDVVTGDGKLMICAVDVDGEAAAAVCRDVAAALRRGANARGVGLAARVSWRRAMVLQAKRTNMAPETLTPA